MKQLAVILLSLVLSGCSLWIYKYDITQGNFLNQRDVDKLRVQMTKEQVEYVLGAPVIENAFNDDKWHYVFTKKSGKTDETSRKELVVVFENNLLADISGDFDKPEEFSTPLDE